MATISPEAQKAVDAKKAQLRANIADINFRLDEMRTEGERLVSQKRDLKDQLDALDKELPTPA